MPVSIPKFQKEYPELFQYHLKVYLNGHGVLSKNNNLSTLAVTCPDIPKLLIILRVSAWAWLSLKHMQVVLHFAGMDLCWCQFQILLFWNAYCKHRFVIRGCFVNIKVFPWYSNWYFSFLIKYLFLSSLINGSLFCFGIHVKFLSIH